MEEIRHHLPYALLRQENGSYDLVDRRYRTLANFRLTIQTKMAQTLSWKGSSNREQIWLYNDGCIPTRSDQNWADYSKRLQKLAGYQVREGEKVKLNREK